MLFFLSRKRLNLQVKILVNMRRVLLLLMAVTLCFVCSAQNIKNNRKDVEKIKKSGTSFWSETGE